MGEFVEGFEVVVVDRRDPLVESLFHGCFVATEYSGGEEGADQGNSKEPCKTREQEDLGARAVPVSGSPSNSNNSGNCGEPSSCGRRCGDSGSCRLRRGRGLRGGEVVCPGSAVPPAQVALPVVLPTRLWVHVSFLVSLYLAATQCRRHGALGEMGSNRSLVRIGAAALTVVDIYEPR